ncbi:hypothetical protein [Oscillatoria salina]|uniref:hypothetical protein n=1 Tax=Oscillatoria salina TaxID=331517 RepID=UPI0013BD1E78|nr:hypothetical protein [Oscillatoria salina]MBZ8183218.1 hypothetical protein [Oscillatoria salina IIICB1]NET88549.1 hypothetical protein [Kamptonema sp. SIO1D9]
MNSNSQKKLLQGKAIYYRNWLIKTKVINGKLWLRWQHPAENFPRYSYPVGERGLSDTIRYVRLLIDLAITLEQGATDD